MKEPMDENRLLGTDEVERYRRYLKQEERAPATISKYLHDIRLFLEYRGGTGKKTKERAAKRLNLQASAGPEPRPVSREEVLAFKEQLVQCYQPRSVNSMLAALNSFFTFMGWSDLRVKFIKIQRQMFCEEERELSREEYYRLVKAAGGRGRERLCLALQTLCGLGLRISELKAVTAEAVRNGRLRILNKGKGRTVFMGRTLQARLLAYMKRKKIKKGEVFTTRTGRGLNRSNLWREMKQLCETSGVPWNKIFPHNLRHLFARTFYAAQKDVVRLADIMGHSNIETTRIYTASSGKECRRKIEELGLVL
ncbi:integrase [Clostridiaceae bacterium]|nr:integrase [Clostridiaceae bacterium]